MALELYDLNFARSDEATRTRTEIIIKTVALQVAVIAAAGHLNSLQNVSRKRWRAILWEMAWFIAVPMYHIAALLNRTVQCIGIIRRIGRRSVSVGYCVSGILGLHATHRTGHDDDKFDSLPLFSIPLEDVRRVRKDRGLFWVGRVVVLAASITQAVATLVLSGRRLSNGQLGEIDIRNAAVALGGLLVQLMGLAILLRSERWEINGDDVTTVLGVAQQREEHGLVSQIIMTASIVATSWYFRFHILDTSLIVMGVRDLSGYGLGWDYPLAAHSMHDMQSPSLPNFVWLMWVGLLHKVQRENGGFALVIGSFLSLSFSIQELVKADFTPWKDPLSERMYVF
ncbi:hypothetical protein BCR34DRAFT_597308 [Clohesyomyces aquaticus]|uniref:Uncharacterized protein n=1 Tax=Clohesyomyces aquaticus TaxID=1231657 RepID=A0A1Y2A336_9PLEO|nr:hypothetical protein BCR34DRAFT_597308 [Clohesyomyces aquaticus]